MHIYRATAAIVAHSLAGVCKVNSFANHTTRDATLTYQTLNYFDQDEVAFLPRQLRAPRFSRMSQYPSRLNVQCCTLCAFTIRVWMSSTVHCVSSQFSTTRSIVLFVDKETGGRPDGSSSEDASFISFPTHLFKEPHNGQRISFHSVSTSFIL